MLRSFASCCLLTAGLFCFSCHTNHPAGSASPDTAATPDAPLRNTRWVLRTLAGAATPTPAGAREVYLQFADTANRISGQAPCNRFFGEFTQPGAATLTFAGIGATRMFCDQMTTETQYLRALNQTSRYQITGDTLRLYAPSQPAALATFEAVYTQ